MMNEREILDALSGVRDPELDESITELGFVGSLDVSEDGVDLRLRLPTYFCAPNFAYLMADDARKAVLSVPGIRQARVHLDDHFASEEINAGLGKGHDLEGTFPGETNGEDLDELREWFQRKAFVARQQAVCRILLSGGRTPKELVGMELGQLPESREASRYLDLRRERGLDLSPEAPLLVDPDGRPIPGDAAEKHLRYAGAVSTNIEANAGMCRAVLASRYGLDAERHQIQK